MADSKMHSTVTVADYLFTRLRQLDVESVHGVPGDYNLKMLDFVEPNGLHWVGNCNELNSAYAADGYARLKGLSALITTFGVGELSAINGIAGAYAELAPVVHIVGTPERKSQEDRAKIHHTFADGDYQRFALMHRHITVAQAELSDPRTCAQLIDSTLQQCLIHSRPVYLALPADVVAIEIDATPLQTSIELPRSLPPSADAETALTTVLDRIYASQRPMILVDGESRAYGILAELQQLSTVTDWPTWTTIFGKSCMEESQPNFRGIWKGSAASQHDKDFVKGRDLILCFGPHFSSTNSYGYSSVPDAKISVHFMQTSVQVDGQTFRDLPAKQFLSALLAKLASSKMSKSTEEVVLNGERNVIPSPSGSAPLTQDHFYKFFNQYLRSGDVILAETGTAGHGCRDFKLPPHSLLLKPTTWLSIGYMLPATQGAGLAQRELHTAGRWSAAHKPRTVLLIGDGSFQMTVQELSTIIREKLNVLLILINNDGYTIERCLHGWDQGYNDIARWRYLQAPAFFGANEGKGGAGGYRACTYRAETWEELEKVMAEEDGEEPMLKMVEVVMDREDAPITLKWRLQQQKDAAAVGQK